MNGAECKSCSNLDCLIKKVSLESSVSELLKEKHTTHYKKGQHIIVQGAPIHGLHFVYNGIIKVSKEPEFGKEQIIRFAKEGEIIGHRGFGIGEIYNINGLAMSDTVMCSFNTDVMLNLLKTSSKLTFELMLFYADELNKSETRVTMLSQMTVREKVIDTILYLYRKFGQSDGNLNILVSRKEIADFAGTNDEQVIRVISNLKKENLLSTQGKNIGIPNVELLKKEISYNHFFLTQ